MSEQEISNVLARQRSDTGGLDFEIKIKETARIMLTNNRDLKICNYRRLDGTGSTMEHCGVLWCKNSN